MSFTWHSIIPASVQCKQFHPLPCGQVKLFSFQWNGFYTRFGSVNSLDCVCNMFFMYRFQLLSIIRNFHKSLIGMLSVVCISLAIDFDGELCEWDAMKKKITVTTAWWNKNNIDLKAEKIFCCCSLLHPWFFKAVEVINLLKSCVGVFLGEKKVFRPNFFFSFIE